jgi:hypothetical protein
VGLFSGRNKLGKLTTVILQPDEDGWGYSWIFSQRHQYLPDGHSESLELALDEVAAIFQDYAAPREIVEGACLQYATYPWPNSRAKQIYDIGGHEGLYVATDIKGSGLRVTGPTVGALISAIEETSGATVDDAVLRWERPVPLS